MSTPVELSVVVPVFNEEEVLPLLQQRLVTVLDGMKMSWEVVFVDDGSHDRTFELLSRINKADPRFKVLSFSRNFGHQIAVASGLEHASGNLVAVMDADLQDPPELLSQCIAHWREGYEVVYAIRNKRKEGLFKRASYAMFYRFLHMIADVDIPLDSGDFCLMDRRVVDVLNSMPERNIFVRGMRAWSGFRQIGVVFERDNRAAGSTKYPFRKLVSLAMDGIFSFSVFPLRLASGLGLSLVVLCILSGFFILVWRMFGFRFMGHTPDDVPGWTGLALGLSFFSGMQLLMLGIIGEYIGRIYTEVKARPRWIIRKSLGFEAAQPSSRVERATL